MTTYFAGGAPSRTSGIATRDRRNERHNRKGTLMADTLAGTVALVTGSSSGIGAATARRLAAEGAAVALVARRRDRLEELAGSIRQAAGTAHVVPADITEPPAAVAAVRETVGRYGRLDILVNNAGVMLLGPALQTEIGE
jgi:NADP-dependent 3-hydroxy acid dehydrogenase YdfG